ncbi:MAG: ferrous iron transporter B [Planctomycetota bacterium]|nr:MAG: ferrous iron transporter B [Planctomycetota bacterium]
MSETIAASPPRTIAVLGNPNVGKTTLFNRLCGARHKTANFPGTTQEALVGRFDGATLIDLPGIYSLDLNLSESSICRAVLAGQLAPEGGSPRVPDTLVVVVDATNLLRNLTLVAEALRLRLPTVVVVNIIDAARRRGIHADTQRLSEVLGCPVLAVSARSGENTDRLPDLIARAKVPDRSPPEGRDAVEAWAEETYAFVAAAREGATPDTLTDRLDRAFTHPVMGVITFVAVMTGLFWVIFALAAYPMDWIDRLFAGLGGLVESTLPAGAIRDLLSEGVVAGIGGTVIFLPQICLLFLLISLLEGTGYLARAAFVIDRLMRPFGLSGHSFVPLLSSHACALPGIMACRAVPDKRDRLATILVAPFMSCTARIPVYVLLTTLLFPGRPAMQALAFTGCYVIGAAAGLLSALVARRSILRGKSRPMALELPSYRVPDFVQALRMTADRGWVFLRKAGTVIVGISIVLWWLNAYPHASSLPEAESLRAQAAQVEPSDPSASEALRSEADTLDARHAASSSFLGRIGDAVQPVFGPMGADRQLTVGILASFAAREVFVATMAVQVAGTDDTEDAGVQQALASATRDDGTPLFTPATSWALLVYYILAMQCLPTLVVTAREAGGWRWAALQMAWMSGMAYCCAVAVYQIIRAMGHA